MTTRIDPEGDSAYTVLYSTEFDLRDGLAAVARMSGWDVDTEHVVPGWGRPDLYLSSGYSRVAVELKLSLQTQSQCRKAVQQADSYRLALPEVDDVILVAVSINSDVMAEYRSRYPHVHVLSVNRFFGYLYGRLAGLDERHREARRRFQTLERDLEIHRRVLARLSEYVESPIGVNIPESPTAETPVPVQIDLI